MAAPFPLPDHLAGSSFDRATARRAGVTKGRLRRADVLRPFTGVHTTRAPSSTWDRCQAYSVRLKEGQFFTHGTAAVLLGLPVPGAVEREITLHVGAVRPADAPHSRGVLGHRLTELCPIVHLDGLPVVGPFETFCQLGGSLGLEDLVVVADHLLAASNEDETSVRALLLDQVGAFRRIGGGRLLRAVQSARRGSASPAETRVRLVLDAGAIPPAELNAKLFDDRGRYLGKPDFVWRAQRVVLEYEGDGHREQARFRADIACYDALAAAGWRVVRATADDLTPAGRRILVQRVLKALS